MLSITMMPPILIISMGALCKPKIEIISLFKYPDRGDSKTFHASAPINEGSINGTRKSAFIVFLKGKSVRATNHAKKVPTTVERSVVPAAIMNEFKSAL
ncbi:MAG: hypothetical protein BWX81_01700 [Spirochaetes bacterium ADurb.Bin110]|nr:MAG: hypothetical protein BWX81_01700 [Spirochaetes bacterium ADurb.Bin110]